MDIPVIIIGLILLSMIALPLYFVVKANQVNQKQIKSLFEAHSQDRKYTFELIATQGRKVLGLDKQKKGLLFIDLNLTEPYVNFQDLQHSKSCEVAIANPQGKTNTLKKVEWIFMAKNGNADGKSVLFHDSERSYLVPVYAQEELKLAQQWRETIQRYL